MRFTYEEVQDCGQPLLSVRRVCTEKTVDGCKRIKARLVARGFEEIPSEKVRVDSPIGSKEVLRILMALMASNGWTCNTIDIKAAFSQGNKLDHDVHLKPRVEVESDGKLWKLNKCVLQYQHSSVQLVLKNG